MNDSLLKSQALPSLLGGLARRPLPSTLGFAEDSNAALHALSLTGQALRFERPTTPPHFAVEPVLEDERKLIPESLRRPLVRLLTGKTATDHPAMACARAFDELRLRPHPFDLPRLDAFVCRHADQLGVSAQHWAHSKSENIETVGYYDRDVLDETNWTETTPTRRATFFALQRRTDATNARGLLEAAWPGDNADIRVRLLQTMQIHLSSADQPFLETLHKDRSPRVRQTAKRLLARLGVTTENPALKAALERITRTQTGLLRKRPTLKLDLPATVKEQAAPRWIRESFADITLEEVATAHSLSVAETIEASAKDANLLLALGLIATIDSRIDLLETIVTNLPNAWELFSMSGLQDLSSMSGADRQCLAAILIRPYGRKLPWDYATWNWLHLAIDSHAPELLLESAFNSGWFDEPPSVAKHTQYWMEVIAALCPASQRQSLLERLEAFDPTLTVTAIPLLHLLDALENSKAHV